MGGGEKNWGIFGPKKFGPRIILLNVGNKRVLPAIIGGGDFYPHFSRPFWQKKPLKYLKGYLKKIGARGPKIAFTLRPSFNFGAFYLKSDIF